MQDTRSLHEKQSAAGGSPPPIVMTIGLKASASTWVFNVVRELMISAVGAERVLAIYSDQPKAMPAPTALGNWHLILSTKGLPNWSSGWSQFVPW